MKIRFNITKCDILKLLQEVERNGGSDYIQTTFNYIVSTGEIADEEAFLTLLHDTFTPETEVKIMTLAERFLQRGKAEGRLQGLTEGELAAKRKIAQRLLQQGQALETISELTELTIEELQTLLH